MSKNVQVILNFNRSELVKPGWSKSRLASSMQPAQFFTSLIGGPSGYIKGPMPEDLWREPNKGIITMKPHVLKKEYWEEPDNDPYKIALSQFNVGNPDNYLGQTVPGGSMSILTQRDNSSGSTGELLSSLATAAETALLTALAFQLGRELVWCMHTVFSLYDNEGWSVWVHPPGIYTDRATDYMLISFGGRYCLHLKMNGTASLWVDQDYIGGGYGGWVEKEQFNISKGGVDHNKPFQITVIPLGFAYISFQFSQTFESKGILQSTHGSPQSTSFLYDIQASEGFLPEYDVILDQYIKTYAAPLGVALRRYLFQYGFAWARIRYSADEITLPVVAESIPEPTGTIPNVVDRGFDNLGSISSSFVNVDGTPWNADTNTLLVVKHKFISGFSNVYTPELWSTDMDVSPVIQTSAWTPRNINHWTMLRFQRTVNPQISTCDIKLDDNSTDYQKLLHFWGPIRVTYQGVVVFDGYRVQPQPSVGGPLTLISTDIECHDMWLRLNERYLADYKFLDKLSLLAVIKEIIIHCGFLDTDIHVIDPTGALATIEFDGFTDPNEQKAINPDSTGGQVIEEILRGYNLIPIRVRPINGQWYIYLAPQFSGTIPAITYFIGGLPDQTDTTKFAAHQYRISSESLEWTCNEVEFNGLIARASTGSDEGADGIEGIIPATYADPDSVSNPDSFWYIARAKVKVVSPPQIPSCTSQGELEKALRTYWERYHRVKPILEFKGEWQPEVDCDTFIRVLGYNKSNTLVSYGVYRIDSIDVQVTLDPDQSIWDTRWDTEGSFTCRYIDRGMGDDIPFFTTEYPT